jgi:hypothetical protein
MIHVIARSTPMYMAQCIELFSASTRPGNRHKLGKTTQLTTKAVTYFDSKLLIFGESFAFVMETYLVNV